MSGPLRAVMAMIPQSKALDSAIKAVTADREDLEAQQAQLAEDTATLREVHTGMMEQLDRVRQDLAEREQAEQAEQARLAEEAEQQQIQAMLDALPHPGSPAHPGPFTPSGELHELPPSHPGHKEQLAALSDQGNLPRRLEKGGPPTLGTLPTPDPSTLAHPQDPHNYQPQPISISLNER
jgi:hypothetical protein